MTQKKWISLAIFVIVLAAGLLYLSLAHTSAKGPMRQAGSKEILDQVRSFNSPVVLINFWASWCEPCKEEFPSIMRARKEFESKGLRVVFVSVDETEDAGAALSFLKEQQVDFPTFYKGSQSLNFVAEVYPAWTGAVPATVLMGKDLKILDAWEGDTTYEELQERLNKQLKGT
jgi:thiol-disulfide isomerase/thioredoxin